MDKATLGAYDRDAIALFEPERVVRALAPTQVLLDEQLGSLSSGKQIRRIVARKPTAET